MENDPKLSLSEKERTVFDAAAEHLWTAVVGPLVVLTVQMEVSEV